MRSVLVYVLCGVDLLHACVCLKLVNTFCLILFEGLSSDNAFCQFVMAEILKGCAADDNVFLVQVDSGIQDKESIGVLVLVWRAPAARPPRARPGGQAHDARNPSQQPRQGPGPSELMI